MAVLRALVVLLLPTCLLVLVAPVPPAAACSCAGGDLRSSLESSDTSFVGTLTKVTPPPGGTTVSSVEPATYRFEVTAVFEGQAHEVTEVLSAQSGASCGLEGMNVGTRYLVFAGHETIEGKPDAALSATLCGGTQPASGGLVAQVEDIVGPGGPPLPGEALAPTSTRSVAARLLGLLGVATAGAMAPVATALVAVASWVGVVGF